MTTFWIDKPDELMKKIISDTFPSYRGKKIKVSTDIPSCLNSYWSGGSRTSFCFYQTSTGKSYDVHSNHPFFEKDQPRNLNGLPPGILLVSHSIFCGKDMGITIYAQSIDLTKMIELPRDETSPDEVTVLQFTSRYKNSYGGETQIRFHEANRSNGISRESWLKAKASLIEKKLLRKNGSITPNGRNALAASR